VTFIEGLRSIVVRSRDLERGRTETWDHECEGTKEIDRQRISTFRHTQYIFEEGLFFVRNEVLLVDCRVIS
jgi:hypothetical protein